MILTLLTDNFPGTMTGAEHGLSYLVEHDNNVQTKKTISYLRKTKAEHIHPSHCTALPALSAFYQAFNIKLLTTGEVLDL